MRLATNSLKMALSVVGIGSFVDAAKDGLYAIMEQSITESIHRNIQQLQLYYGTKTIVNMISEPCLENMRIAGARVIKRPEDRSMRDCMRDWYWSINKDPKARTFAEENFPEYVSDQAMKTGMAGAAGGVAAVVGFGAATVATGGAFGVTAGLSSLFAGAAAGGTIGFGIGSATTVLYDKGPSGTYVDIVQLAGDVSSGVIDMFEPHLEMYQTRQTTFVMWSDFEANEEQVKYAQRYFMNFLKKDIADLVEERKKLKQEKAHVPLKTLTASQQVLVDAYTTGNFDTVVSERLDDDRYQQFKEQNPFIRLRTVYEQSEKDIKQNQTDAILEDLKAREPVVL